MPDVTSGETRNEREALDTFARNLKDNGYRGDVEAKAREVAQRVDRRNRDKR